MSGEEPTGQILLYQTADGTSRIECRFEGETLWLSLNQMADLFARDKSVISKHLKAIFEDGELDRSAVVANRATTAADGKTYQVDFYNLEAVFAVGYRARSPRGIQFRNWATARLKEYAIKGFVMDDERLKNPGGWDYFDELFARIRDIRASEKRFYQKARDLFALSRDNWRENVDRMLQFNEQAVLDGAGSVSNEDMKRIVEGRYEVFDAKRREREALEADAEDLKEIEEVEKDLKRKGGKA